MILVANISIAMIKEERSSL